MSPWGWWLAVGLLGSPTPCRAESYGAKDVFPVYDVSGAWLVFDKARPGKSDRRLREGNRFLTIGSEGSAVLMMTGFVTAPGGACKGAKPLRLRAGVLSGSKKDVGNPVIAILVPARFNVKGSRAAHRPLANQVGERTYRRLLDPLRRKLRDEAVAGAFRSPQAEAPTGPVEGSDEAISSAVTKIEFGTAVPIAGLTDPFLFVEGTQASGAYRRCLRLADGERIVGACAPMPHVLMAETSRLAFVAYDPSGRGKPFLLAYTPEQPMWGHERWAFTLRPSGPRAFLADSMDIRCREGF